MVKGQAQHCIVRLENAAVIRGGRLVLQKMSLDARGGDIIWLRGPNGSGKSTLLRLISGLLPLASGTIQVDGSLALADDNLALDPNLPLEKALNFWADMDGSSAIVRQSAIEIFDISALTEIPVSYLSSGQRKRAALARIMASNAQIWLLDEPYNGLDSANMTKLDDALTKHAQRGGIAIVAAHQPASINVANTISLGQPSESVPT